jgi:hypothetical protein
MGLKHRVSINVVDPGGGKTNVLRGGVRRLPQRVIHFLFGDAATVLVLKPGQSIESIEVRELGREAIHDNE